jgi:hypothetical protein
MLAFAGIEPATALAITKPQQFAEKLHACTFPWAGRVNTRTKDLVDLVLLIERGEPNVEQIQEAIDVTFTTRGTHELPGTLPPPPESWKVEFVGMAIEANLSTTDYLGAFEVLEKFWTRARTGAS